MWPFWWPSYLVFKPEKTGMVRFVRVGPSMKWNKPQARKCVQISTKCASNWICLEDIGFDFAKRTPWKMLHWIGPSRTLVEFKAIRSTATRGIVPQGREVESFCKSWRDSNSIVRNRIVHNSRKFSTASYAELRGHLHQRLDPRHEGADLRETTAGDKFRVLH